MPISTINPWIRPDYYPYMGPYNHPNTEGWGRPSYDVNNIPIIKDYTINISGPMADHYRVSQIYEHMMPSRNFSMIPDSSYSRIAMSRYIKSTISNGDTHISISGNTNNNSILSHLKFMDLNPYGDTKKSENPYKTLPNDILIYRSGFPIRFDERTRQIKCAKNSVGMNIRIYPLTNFEWNNKSSIGDKMNWNDVFIENSYYNYVKRLVNEKKCPNFVLSHAHFTCDDNVIDYKKLYEARGIARPEEPETITKEIDDPVNPGKKINITVSNPKAFSGKSFIIITESPTHSIQQWATPIYNSVGIVKSMIQSGFHTDNVWYSVLFQMFAGLYTLQKEGVYMNSLDLNGILIKDIHSSQNDLSYWKYVINGAEYYIPNYGYMVMIDSTYKDVSTPPKIMTNEFSKTKIYNEDKLKGKFINILNRCFGKLGNLIQKSEIITPSKNIVTLIENIINKINKKEYNIDEYIIEFMKPLLNNRIGTYLTESEVIYINKTPKTFNQGELVVYEESYDVFRVGIYHKIDKSDKNIITKNKDNYEHVHEPQIYGLVMNHNIKQNIYSGEPSFNSSPIDTYTI